MLETEPRIVQEDVATGRVRLVYRHLLQIGESSVITAEASECAADQGRFWETRRALYEQQRQLYSDPRQGSIAVATDLRLDVPAFTECLDNHTHLAAVQADYDAAVAEGIRSRPVFTVGAQQIVGAQQYEVFQQAFANAQ